MGASEHWSELIASVGLSQINKFSYSKSHRDNENKCNHDIS